ncbi:GLUG motif-containing protein [uncultured Flavobacterium sp.]|uniref:GLUG motif-containing protein n=1 Tax=uncultured Flavobacterium sp. TaxID=165435 RepID=UPI003081BC2A
MIKKLKFAAMPFFKYVGMLALLLVVGYSCSNEGIDEGVVKPLSSAKAITSFSFVNPVVKGTIDESAHTISLTFPGGTDLTNLAATFTTTGTKVTIADVVQVSGTTKNNFSKVITYTVTAEDGTKQNYTITPPNSADILGFTFEGSNDEAYWELSGLKEGTNTIYNAPAGLDFVTGFPILPPGAEITQSGENEESDYHTTGFSFTVTAGDGKTKKSYIIKIPAYDKDANPYGIYNPAHLLTVDNNLLANFKVMNDITMPAVNGTEILAPDYATQGWMPIGDFESFRGTLDGNNHVIKNLTIKRTSHDDVAFISTLGAKGVVKNLGLTAVNIQGSGNVGALVANNVGGTISHCYSTGTVTSTGLSVQKHVGGLVGINNDANGKPGKLLNSYSTVNVSGKDSFVGGLVGYNYLCAVENCYATGSVTGPYKNGGALIGKNASELLNCYATGKVEVGGGLVGLNFNWSSAPNCFWDIQTTGQTTSDDGGEAVGKTTAQMKSGTPYSNTWTAANWIFTAGKYPTLVGVGGQ